MADIKTRDAVKGTIKTIDKAAIASERMKSVYAKTKDKAEQGYYAEEGSATEYAADKLSYTADRVKDEGIHQFNKQGQKSVQATKGNIVKAKEKAAEFQQKRAAKAGSSPPAYKWEISPTFVPRKYAIPCSLSSVTTSVTEVGASTSPCHNTNGETFHKWDNNTQLIAK